MVSLLVRPHDGAELRRGLFLHQPSSCRGGVFLFTFLSFFYWKGDGEPVTSAGENSQAVCHFVEPKKKKKI